MAVSENSPIRYRPIRSGDLPAAIPLMEQDRSLYEPGTWRRLPAILEQLLQRGRLRGMVIEEVASGRLRFAGLTGFATLESLGPAIKGDVSLPELLIAGGFLLPPSRMAAANAARNLHLVSLCGCPDVADYSEPDAYRLHRAMYDAFAFLHRGYGLCTLWTEAAVPEALAYLQGFRFTVVRQRAGGSHLLRYTAEQAEADPTGLLAVFFKFPPSRLRLTRQQQQVLELALLDLADREVQEWLALSDEALKKRWHSAYARVRQSVQDLLPEGLSGADQRRVLLGYLRQHPEELRLTTRR